MDERFGLGLINPVETGECGTSVCVCDAAVWVGAWARVWKGGVVLCLCVL